MRYLKKCFDKFDKIINFKRDKDDVTGVKCIRVFSDEDTNDAFGRIVLSGDDIERYIKDNIINYSHDISKEIFKTYFEPGKYSYNSYWRKDAPVHISFAEICGGSIDPVPQMCSKWMPEIVHKFLIDNEYAVVLMEDIMFNADDQDVKELQADKISYNNKLYYIFTHQSHINNPSVFLEALSIVEMGFNDTIMLMLYDNQDELRLVVSNNDMPSEKIVKKMIDNTKIVFFMAYDRQGYIMWNINE